MQMPQPKYKQIYKDHKGGAEKAINAAIFYAEAIKHLEDIDFLTKPRAAIADRYARARAEYENLYSASMINGPTKQGKKGGEYADMGWCAIKNLSDQICKFEDALLIAPKAAGGTVPSAPRAPTKTAASEFIDN